MRAPLLSVLMILALLAPAAVAAEVEPSPPPTLHEQRLGQNDDLPDPFPDVTITGTCEPGESTFSFEVTGFADGPYPGTFTETGTFTLGAPVPTYPGDTIGQREVLQFEAEFTITSGSMTVTGTKTLTGNGLGECNETEEENEIGAGVGASANGGFEYEAFVATPEGGPYRDEGQGFWMVREFLHHTGTESETSFEQFSSGLDQTQPPPPPGYVFGTVEGDGTAVAGASVLVYTADENQDVVAYASTDDHGYYEATGIRPGDYRVEVYPPEPTGGRFFFGATSTVTVADAGVQADFDLATAALTMVSGVLKLADGTPVADTAVVVCWDRNPCRAPQPEASQGGPGIAQTADNGSFQMSGLPAVTVDVAAWDPDYGDSFVVASDVELGSPTHELNLTLARGPASIEGTFRYAENDPVVDGRVWWRYCNEDADVSRRVRSTASDGSFVIRGLAAAPGCVAIRGLDVDTRKSAQTQVEYSSNSTTGASLVLPPLPTGGIRVEVADTRGVPVAGASVWAFDDSSYEDYDETDGAGVALFRRIEDGSSITVVVRSFEMGIRRQVSFTMTVGTTIATVPVVLPAIAQGDDGTAQLGDQVTSAQPVSAAVSNPAGGTVTITEGAPLEPSGGYRFLGRVLTIEATEASVEEPIALTFTVHSSLLSGVDPSTVDVFRDGEPADDCASAAQIAEPDPCVYARTVDAAGDLTLVVLTSHASDWSLGAPAANSPRVMKTQAIAVLRGLLTGDKNADRRINTAIERIQKSLKLEWWIDDETLAAGGAKVFDAEKQAVKALTMKGLAANTVAQSLVQLVLDADRALAKRAIDDAFAAGAKAKGLQAANDELAKGDAERANGRYEQAVDRYKAAWANAQKARR